MTNVWNLFFHTVLILGPLLVVLVRGSTWTNPVDVASLQALYDSTDGDYWQWTAAEGTQWNFTSNLNQTDPCGDDWEGISCGCVNITSTEQACNVTSIILDSNGMYGPLPSQLCNMASLSELSLTVNHISGTIPQCMFNYSGCDMTSGGGSPVRTEGCALFSSLRTLDLTDNYITDIPEVLCGDPQASSCGSETPISFLDMHYNLLGGTIPSSLGRLAASLGYLDISRNQLTGPVPSQLGNLSVLSRLNIGRNELTSTLPTGFFSSLSTLTFLSMQTNSLSGELPATLAACTALKLVTVYLNSFTGEVGSIIGSLGQLTLLDLATNAFHGEVLLPAVTLGKLLVLDVSGNSFNGTIPTSIGTVTTLKYLYLETNSFTGTVPSQINSLGGLKSLYMSSNSLIGKLPSNFGQSWPSMISLVLGTNSMHGPLPSSMCNMGAMTVLDVDNNELSGTIPTCLLAISSLKAVYLNGNDFTGSIPSALNPSMESINAISNHFSGSLPPSFAGMTALKSFAADYNSLSGSLPTAMGDLTALQILQIESNHLTGTIPFAVGQFPALYTLILAQNFLSGTITAVAPPPGSVSNMLILDLGANVLRGTIPSVVGGLTNLNLLKLNNNELTGDLPSSLLRLVGVHSLLLQANSLSGNVNDVLSVNGSATDLDAVWPLLASVDMSGNAFSGSVPTALFTLSGLQNVSLSKNCFDGSVPSEICSAPKLQTLCLDGLASGLSCRIPIALGANENLIVADIYTTRFVEGSLPSCMFSDMTSMQVLHMAGNGLFSSLPEISSNMTQLVEVAMSHNRFYSTIPASWLQSPNLLSLDLSFNRLGGTIENLEGIYNVPISNSLSSNASSVEPALKLKVNRLSGALPSLLQSAPNVDVLSGNLFSCDLDRRDLPASDPYADKYVCGSDNLDISVYFTGFCMCVVVVLIVCVVLRKRKVQSKLQDSVTTESDEAVESGTGHRDRTVASISSTSTRSVSAALRASHRESIATTVNKAVESSWALVLRTSHIAVPSRPLRAGATYSVSNNFFNTKAFVLICGELRQLCIVVASIALVVHLPTYTCLKVLGSEHYNTHTRDYGWLISSAYLTSAGPGLVLLLVWLLLCALVLVLGRRMRFKVIDDHDEVAAATGRASTSGEGTSARSANMKEADGGDRGSFVGALRHTVHNWSSQRDLGASGEEELAADKEFRKAAASSASATVETVDEDNSTASVGADAEEVSAKSPSTQNDAIGHADDASSALDYGAAVKSQPQPQRPSVSSAGSGEGSSVDASNDKRNSASRHSGSDRASGACRGSRGSRGSRSSRSSEGSANSIAAFAKTSSSAYRYVFIRLTQLLCNCFVVLLVNGLYVWVELSQGSTIRWLAVAFLTAFKLAWNMFVVPRLIDWQIGGGTLVQNALHKCFPSLVGRAWQREPKFLRGSTLLQYTIVMFNNVLAPCVAVAVTASQCFLNVFVAPAAVENTVVFEQCEYFTMSDTTGVATCTAYGSSSPSTTSFDPPFIYSYQCSSSLLTTYIPVFLLQFALSGAIFPVVRLLLMHYTRSVVFVEGVDGELVLQNPMVATLPDGRNRYSPLVHTFHSFIPLNLWPIEYSLAYRRERLCAMHLGQVVQPFVEARVIIFGIIGAYAVLLTFGVAYPPLAVVIAISVTSMTVVWHMIIQRHIDDCYAAEQRAVLVAEAEAEAETALEADAAMKGSLEVGMSPAVMAAAADIELVRSKLESDCANLWKVFTKSLSLLLACCSLFFGLYFLDLVPQDTTYCWVAMAVPLGWHLFKSMWRLSLGVSYKKASKVFQRTFAATCACIGASVRSVSGADADSETGTTASPRGDDGGDVQFSREVSTDGSRGRGGAHKNIMMVDIVKNPMV